MEKERTEKIIKEKLAEINEKYDDLRSVGGSQSLFDAISDIVDDKSIYLKKIDFLLGKLLSVESNDQVILDIAKTQAMRKNIFETGKIKKDDLIALNTIYRRVK